MQSLLNSALNLSVLIFDCTNRNLVEINYPDLVVGEPTTERFLSYYTYSDQEKKTWSVLILYPVKDNQTISNRNKTILLFRWSCERY